MGTVKTQQSSGGNYIGHATYNTATIVSIVLQKFTTTKGTSNYYFMTESLTAVLI